MKAVEKQSHTQAVMEMSPRRNPARVASPARQNSLENVKSARRTALEQSTKTTHLGGLAILNPAKKDSLDIRVRAIKMDSALMPFRKHFDQHTVYRTHMHVYRNPGVLLLLKRDELRNPA